MNFKRAIAYLIVLCVYGVMPAAVYAGNSKTFCTMTFNSENEKQVFQKYLIPAGYQSHELVPENKDPNWLSKACQSSVQCDILLISGHFGGLFFGEHKSATLSVDELKSLRHQKTCSGIIDAQAIYLMGCNTLATKIKDHRTVDQYLRVLVNDGFPLQLAENVAAARYLDFGQSVGEWMRHIFSQSKLIVGFDSTGPLGRQAAPLLEKTLAASNRNQILEVGLSVSELQKNFKRHNLKIMNPQMNIQEDIFQQARSSDSIIAVPAWAHILSSDKLINQYYDFILLEKQNLYLKQTLLYDSLASDRLKKVFMQIYRKAQGLSAVQMKTLQFLNQFQLIQPETMNKELSTIVKNITNFAIDYVSADQLCEIFKTYPELGSDVHVQQRIRQSSYQSFLEQCRGALTEASWTPVRSCLYKDKTYRHDWACLTDNAFHLDVTSCLQAKSQNTDPENGDDMLWYCYSQMAQKQQLDQPSCLQLTHGFSLLGNRIKMNWNCLNLIK